MEFTDRLTQQDRILVYLTKFGSIDRLRALRDCGIFELSARLCELEKRGYRFKKAMKSGTSRFGYTFHYVEYSFTDEMIAPEGGEDDA